MSDPTERRKALVAYCADHRCRDCPMNDPQLGALDEEDLCLVGMAMDALLPDMKAAS